MEQSHHTQLVPVGLAELRRHAVRRALRGDRMQAQGVGADLPPGQLLEEVEHADALREDLDAVRRQHLHRLRNRRDAARRTVTAVCDP
jgi:hypothetical protein